MFIVPLAGGGRLGDYRKVDRWRRQSVTGRQHHLATLLALPDIYYQHCSTAVIQQSRPCRLADLYHRIHFYWLRKKSDHDSKLLSQFEYKSSRISIRIPLSMSEHWLTLRLTKVLIRTTSHFFIWQVGRLAGWHRAELGTCDSSIICKGSHHRLL